MPNEIREDEKATPELSEFTRRLAFIRAALLRNLSLFGIKPGLLSEDHRARLRHVTKLRAFFSALAKEVDLAAVLGSEMNTLTAYDALVNPNTGKPYNNVPPQKTAIVAVPAKKRAPKPSRFQDQDQDQETKSHNNEYNLARRLCAKTRTEHRFNEEEEQCIFRDYIERRRKLTDTLLTQPDAMRAAILLCTPTKILNVYNDEDDKALYLPIQYFTSQRASSHIAHANPVSRFFDKYHDIETIDTLASRASSDKDVKIQDDDEMELKGTAIQVRACSKVRIHGLSFLQNGREEDSTQVVEEFLKLGISPGILEFIARFSERNVSVQLAELKELNAKMIKAYSYYAACQAKSHTFWLDALFAYNVALSATARAIDKFDPSKGMKFGTYQRIWIKEALAHAKHEETETIHLPANIHNGIRRVEKAIVVAKACGKDASPEDIAKKLELSVEQVTAILERAKLKRTSSLDAPHRSGDDFKNKTLYDKVANTAPHPDTEAERAERHELVRHLLDRCDLSEKQRTVLELRYPQDPERQELILEEVGKIIGLTRERARQIEKTAIAKLRRVAENWGIYDEDFEY